MARMQYEAILPMESAHRPRPFPPKAASRVTCKRQAAFAARAELAEVVTGEGRRDAGPAFSALSVSRASQEEMRL